MPVFAEDPHVLLLQTLTKGALKQTLLRAVRLWVWLRLLYADPDDGWESWTDHFDYPPDPFTFAAWRTRFFTPDHPAGENIPPLHNPACPCAKTTREWLLLLAPDLDLAAWQQTLCRQGSLPEHIESILSQRLFGVTRRSLDEDLRLLEKLGWVQRQNKQYARVAQLPNYPSAASAMPATQPLLHPDLVAIAHTLSQPINGHQRFFLHVEYVIPKAATDRVDDWQALLREIWEQTPVPPVQITFYSARLDRMCTRIVYPVCVYYAQRAPYLCAWGELPENPNDQMDWRNYRLDRIHRISALSWDKLSVPRPLHLAYLNHRLPIPESIQEHMAAAWGFDFYQPAALLLLRFDQDFAKRYIDNSLRHETFTAITYAQAGALVRAQITDTVMQQQALQILAQRPSDDAYYRANYRRHDLNILLRLRAWRPHMEVLLPWDLRQHLALEVKKELSLYWPEGLP